jgi:signal transduction histidine kinase
MDDLLEKAIRLRRGGDTFSGIVEILRDIAQGTESFGCILWQQEDESLFVLEDWFPDGVYCRNHALPMDASFTGLAIRTHEQVVVRDVKTEVPKPDQFLVDAGICTFCSTAITFSDGSRGALNLYRNKPQPFGASTLKKTAGIAAEVALAYDITRDRLRASVLSLMMDVERERRAKQTDQYLSPVERAKPVTQQVCTALQQALNCLEVSVFLEDPAMAKGQYDVVATTWHDTAETWSYRASNDDGATGWSLANPRERVRLFELAEANPASHPKFKGMRWRDALKLQDKLAEILQVPDGQQLPPMSFMTAPMMTQDGRVVGIIRCAVGLGPKYFSDYDHRMLEIIASHLGSFWSEVLAARDQRAFELLQENLVRLNAFVVAELAKREPRWQPILDESLRMAAAMIPDAEINDVRLLDEKKNELYFAAFGGEAWNEGSAQDIAERKSRLFPLEGEPRSIGADVVRTGRLKVVNDISKEEYPFRNFPNKKRLIFAPIVLSDRDGNPTRQYGVLTLRSTSDRAFPEHTHRIAELLGSQIALYLKLADTVGENNRALSDLKAFKEVEIRFHEEMAHQFRSPIKIALLWVREALQNRNIDSSTTDLLLTVRGACSRAMHVSSNSNLFALLARDQPLRVHKTRFKLEDIARMIVNTSIDAALLHSRFEKPEADVDIWSGKRRPIALPASQRFNADVKGLGSEDPVYTDRDLLEQAVTQILDNAFKYSKPWTAVEITGGYTSSSQKEVSAERQAQREVLRQRRAAGEAVPDAPPEITVSRRVRIVVRNRGVSLYREDVDKCKERGWQSEQAKIMSQGGAGLGLWIVDKIMEALGGNLEIEPTDKEGWTQFALVFPV